MRNKYPGQCYRCGKLVPIGAGHFERHQGGWRTQHAECAIEHRAKKQGLGYAVDYLNGWNACIDETERLNGMRGPRKAPTWDGKRPSFLDPTLLEKAVRDGDARLKERIERNRAEKDKP